MSMVQPRWRRLIRRWLSRLKLPAMTSSTRPASPTGHRLAFLQSNAEHLLIERIHAARDEKIDCIIINPAAFTHTSVALRDALLAVSIPFFEVHLSNVHKREQFRHHSYFSDVAVGVICGLGASGYRFALDAAFEHIKY